MLCGNPDLYLTGQDCEFFSRHLHHSIKPTALANLDAKAHAIFKFIIGNRTDNAVTHNNG